MDAPLARTDIQPMEDHAGREAEQCPLVAIVTPVFNGAKYLRQAMESVQRQSYPNIVHVVCNNASTDESASIMDEYRHRQVPLLVVENETTLPLAANWDKAFNAVPRSAKYAKLLCADDLIRADAIARFVQTAEANSEVEVVLAQDVFADRVHRARLSPEQTLLDGKQVAQSILLNKMGWIAYHHFFIRLHSDYWQSCFIDNYWAPDPHVVMRSALRGNFAYIHAPLLYNRIHPDSVTGKELGKGFRFELVHMDLLNHFGREVLDQPKYRRSTRMLKSTCCRFILRSKLTLHRERISGMREGMAAGGLELHMIDYLLAIVGWPLSSLRWRWRELPLGAEMSEAAFMSFDGSDSSGLRAQGNV